MSRPTPQTRSLTEVPGWLEKLCERCGVTFWSLSSQWKFTRFCSKDCRHEDPMTRLLKNATTNEQGCMIFAGAKNDDGYGNIKWNNDQWRSNRLMWHLKRGPIPDGMDVLHTCKKCPACVNIDHLYVGTVEDNTRDRMEQGHQADMRGEKSPAAKLTDEKVKYIRENPHGLTGVELAAMHGVQGPAISRIKHRHLWKHI